ncbi:MAG: ABC transporter ATP-binding protein [Candidatus Thermoplasmatota archaeon]|jgi:ABC-2 type transport system ATP-binding protein|nr:ABC transporter ATP-binding protein [Candidatus Thermoplasmatota archaeon]MCL5800432.1 ABC transporter ATP-binding protein [Candidatus Thermoplasmatota archaeon]
MSEVIKVESLTKRYGTLEAVRGISFHVNAGEVFSLLGPNGAGKTTTVEILEGVRKRTSGHVAVLGYDPEKIDETFRKRVGVLPQDFNFLQRITPLEALEFFIGSLESGMDPVELLKTVELVDRKDVYFSKLSGGQKQKLGIAIALSNDAELVFLDEPTAGLDPISRKSIQQVMRNLRSLGKTIFLTTHYLEEAEKLADRVAIVNHGIIVDEGTPEELVQKNKTHDTLVVSLAMDHATETALPKGLVMKSPGVYEMPVMSNDDLFSVLDSIAKSRIMVDNIYLKRENLEDVFMRVVGAEPDES